MSLTIYLRPEAVEKYLKWRETGELDDYAFNWIKSRLRLVTPKTSGWVTLNVGIDEWHRINDTFDTIDTIGLHDNMAEFCTKCTSELYGADTTPDIDIQKIAKSLEPDTYATCMCEGCGLAAIGLSSSREILLAMPTNELAKNQEGIPIKWFSLEEFMELPIQI